MPGSLPPSPNHLLDTLLPTLTDSEWRLLCVVVHKTLGFQGATPAERKGRDWLTQSQLKARIGRASEAVEQSIDSLVKKRLIVVCTETGVPLNTPA